MTFLEAALAYVARGWPIFPLEPRGKHPLGRLVPHGLKDASTDPEVVRAWWTEEPEANIGIPTGIAFDVADLDSEEAIRRFLAVAAEHGTDVQNFPRTRTGKGRHVLVAPTGAGNRGKGLLPEMHWRGRGGYIVAPPSVHPGDAAAGVPPGQIYEWLHEPNGSSMPECPKWLRELLQPPSGAPEQRATSSQANEDRERREAYVRAAVEAELEKLRGAREGGRNNTLNDAAFALGQMVGAGWITASTAEIDLRTAAYSTGLREPEVSATIRSGINSGLQEPRELPEATPTGKPGGVILHGRQHAQTAEPTSEEVDSESFDKLVEPGPIWASMAGRQVPVIVRGMLVSGGLGMMISDPKAGKTWLVLELMICTITGRSVLDHYPVENSGRVLYVATEGSREGTLARLKALTLGKDLKLDKVLNGVDFIWRRGVRLDDPAFISWLIEKGADYTLIIVDVLVEAWAGDENKTDQVSRLIRAVRPVTDQGPTVLLLHHLNKKQNEDTRSIWERLRGSTAFTGAYDSGLGLERGISDKRTKVSFQHRDDAPLEPFTFTWPEELVTGEDAINLDWKPQGEGEELAALQQSQLRVMELVRQEPGLSQKEVVDKVPGRASTVRAAIHSLIDAHQLVQRTVDFKRKDGRQIQKPGLFVAGPKFGTTTDEAGPPTGGVLGVGGGSSPTPYRHVVPRGGGGDDPPTQGPPTHPDQGRTTHDDDEPELEL